VHTGIKLEIPIGYEAQIRSRSGIASKKGVFVMNAPGGDDLMTAPFIEGGLADF
jgi:dUTP pyrophosphatase